MTKTIQADQRINAQYGRTAMVLFDLKAVDLKNESDQLSRHINNMHDSHFYDFSCSIIPRGIPEVKMISHRVEQIELSWLGLSNPFGRGQRL